jgi:hypothetical protein
MATKVQKKVLWWMIDNGGELYIMTGHKRVLFDHTNIFGKPNEMFCRGTDNLIHGLRTQGYATSMFQPTEANRIVTHEVNGVVVSREGKELTQEERILRNRFKITEKGIKAAGKSRPDPSEHSNIPHRNHTYGRRTYY